MSIKDRINKLKGKIDARAEEMTVKQENEMRKESIALTKRLIKQDFEESRDGVVEVYSGRYTQVKENDEVKGYEVYKRSIDVDYHEKYTPVKNKNGKTLFSLDELAEYHYEKSQHSEDLIFDSMVKSKEHKERVESNRGKARREVVGEIIKRKIGRLSEK